MTAYLKFNSLEECKSVLEPVGFSFSEYDDHISLNSAYGSVFLIPDEEGIFVNIYDFYGNDFDDIKLPEPSTPYNVRA